MSTYEEIELLHRETMDGLNKLGRGVDEELFQLGMMGDELAEAGSNFEAATERTARRLHLARMMVQGAKDETSLRIAERVVGEWFAPDGAEVLRKLAA
jgi:hypothetical protein